MSIIKRIYSFLEKQIDYVTAELIAIGIQETVSAVKQGLQKMNKVHYVYKQSSPSYEYCLKKKHMAKHFGGKGVNPLWFICKYKFGDII